MKNVKEKIIVLCLILALIIPQGIFTTFAQEPIAITKLSASNYGTYEGVSLWVNCAADFSNSNSNDRVCFFLCKTNESTLNEAIIRGEETTVSSISRTDEYLEIRKARLSSGFLVSDLDAGNYYIGCCLSSGDDTVYSYIPFTVYSVYSEYTKAGLDAIIESYRNHWFIINDKYVGLTNNATSDTGIDWEAWIFPALGNEYDHNGETISFDIDEAFLSSEDGKTYVDWMTELYNKKGESFFKNSSTKDLFRYITALEAVGEDPRNFCGMNIVKMLLNYAYNDDGTPAINGKGQLILPNGEPVTDYLFISYELLGLELANATQEEGYTNEIRRAGIKTILNQYGNGQIDSNAAMSADYYYMAMLPMKFLRDDPEFTNEIDEALDTFKNLLTGSHMQPNGALYAENASDESEYTLPNNPDTTAVAINSLIINGFTNFNDTSFSKKYGSILTALCGDIVEKGVLFGTPNRMATYQTLGALVDIYNGKSCFEIAREKYLAKYPQYNKKRSFSKITVAIEKFSLGQGYIVEPRTMEVDEGETYESIVKRLAEEENLELNCNTANGFYLAGIQNADSGDSVIPYCIEELSEGYLNQERVLPAEEKNINWPDLQEFSYTSSSGWMYLVNNEAPGKGMDQVTAQDGDVVRFAFTLYGLGADIGATLMNPHALQLPDRDAVTVKLSELKSIITANPNAKKKAVYDAVIRIVSNLDYSQSLIDIAGTALDAAIAGQKVDDLLSEMESVKASEDAQIAAKRSGENDPDNPGGETDPDDPAIPETISIAGANIAAVSGQPYTGKAIQPKPAVTLNGKTLKEGRDYKLSYENNKAVGTAKVKATGIGSYSGTVSRTFMIVKAAPKVTANGKTLKQKTLKKRAVSVNAFTVKNAFGKVSFKKLKGSKYLSVTKAGKIKVKKRTPKGTYSIKVKVTVNASSCNTKKTVTKTIKIKVR